MNLMSKILKNKKKNWTLSVLILWLIFSVSGIAQTVKFVKPTDTANLNTQITTIKDSSGNGIIVTAPKVYDDAALILMLNAARSRLASLQVFEQSALTSRIGALTGATLSQRAIAGQIMGPPIPQTVTQSLGATGSTETLDKFTTTDNTQVTTATSGTTTVQTTGNPSEQTIKNIAGLPVQNVTTTIAPQSAVAPTTPQLSASLPTSGYSVSSLNALNEMMQLNYEITNLQLLLEGSLTDRYIEGTRTLKSKTTLGFSVTIQNPEQYRDAVAILEVEVQNPRSARDKEAPAITAILPREKTYNVANISDKMMSFGGGVVTQVINGGFSYLSGRKNYFIVQDQDTLAMMRESPDPNNKTTVFSWQFRPVLGQRIVTSGLKQTFVQLAIPIEADEACFGNLKIKTYWRRFDRKKNLLREVIPDTLRISDVNPVSRIDQTPVIKRLTQVDLGSGVVMATVRGEFLPGTYVRVGNNYYREGSPGFTWELSQIRFMANAAEVARYRAYLVTRDGKETEIVDGRAPIPLGTLINPCRSSEQVTPPPTITSTPSVHVTVTTSTYDSNNSVVTAVFNSRPASPPLNDYIMLIGGKVYGLSDAPVEYSKDSENKDVIRVVVPTKALLNAMAIEVKPLFWKSDYAYKTPTSLFKAGSSTEKVLIYKSNSDGSTTYLIYGNRLKDAKIRTAGMTEVTSTALDASTEETLRLFTLNAQQSAQKEISILKSDNEPPLPLSLPVAKPTLGVVGTVTAGANEITIQGDNLDQLVKVSCASCGGEALPFKLNGDKINLSDMVRFKVTENAGDKDLTFEFPGIPKPIIKTLGISIIDKKVEIVDKPLKVEISNKPPQ